MTVRPTEDEDLLRIGARVDGRYYGWTGVRRGAIVGMGLVTWRDEDDFAMIGFQAFSAETRPWWLGIIAKRFLAQAPFPRDKILLATLRADIPGVRRWLTWLGFRETDSDDGAGGRYWAWVSKQD